jgi:non-heme chloroperoxidase
MPKITTRDGTTIYYRDWGSGPPIVFSHGWPLTGAAWEAQMLFFNDHGYRTVAHDRRGNGYSDQPGSGNDVDTWADDLDELINALDLRGAILVGHSVLTVSRLSILNGSTRTYSLSSKGGIKG